LSALQYILRRHPQDSQSYYAISLIRSAQGVTNEALNALEKAIQLTPPLRDQARNDPRFANLRSHPRFLQLTGSTTPVP
jgi:tetratricopeptide (TPR) repeat protein